MVEIKLKDGGLHEIISHGLHAMLKQELGTFLQVPSEKRNERFAEEMEYRILELLCILRISPLIDLQSVGYKVIFNEEDIDLLPINLYSRLVMVGILPIGGLPSDTDEYTTVMGTFSTVRNKKGEIVDFMFDPNNKSEMPDLGGN
jgi:hypothetical protein